MFAVERQRKIMELVSSYKEVDINTLCSCFSASMSTIRRDLDKLEQDGFLQRTHGGAVLVERGQEPGEPAPGQAVPTGEIARLAAQMPDENDTIFLGAGKICYQMAVLLQNSFHGCVYTNNLNAALALGNAAKARVILLGGELSREDDGLAASVDFSSVSVDNIFVNKIFIDVSALTLQHGYFVSSLPQKRLYEKIFPNSLDAVALVDPEKINRISGVRLGSGLGYFPKVISSMNLPDEYKRAYFDQKVTVYTPFAEA
jgi:DeoR family fructose operon transcriptional repressor